MGDRSTSFGTNREQRPTASPQKMGGVLYFLHRLYNFIFHYGNDSHRVSTYGGARKICRLWESQHTFLESMFFDFH
jgi:hypothetical protein